MATRKRSESESVSRPVSNVLTLPRTAKVTFDAVPEIARAVIEPLLLRYHVLLPAWVQNVFVRWDETGKGDGTLISCAASYDYRSFKIVFDPTFLVRHPDEQRADVIHELVHASSCVLADYARDTIRLLVPEDEAPKFRSALLEELSQRHEAFVQDLALRLVEVL
jgi:hypothetical protein